MADRAIGRETSGDVSRVCRAVVVRLVARNAGRGQVAVVVVGVALRARHGRMEAR